MMDETHDEKPTIRKKGEIVPNENDETEIVSGKILDITPDTPDIDVYGILAKVMQYVNIADAISQVERTAEYIVQIPLKYQEAVRTGELLLNQNSKTGVLWPTLYKTLDNGKRQFVDNLPIKQEEIIIGEPFESIAASYHNLYMQQQISELADMLDKTYHAVERIEQGQLDDRIGMLLAGRDQIILSMKSDPQIRMIAIEQGRGNMIIAQKQLLQTFERRVNNFEAISESGWMRFCLELFHPGTLRQKDKEFSEIQEYYALYLQATQMIAASYAICGQMEQAKEVFEIAEKDMESIDYSALKTLSYIHKKNKDMFFYHAGEYIAAEKEICLEEAQDYDIISIQVSGEKLLEVLKNGEPKEISESKAE